MTERPLNPRLLLLFGLAVLAMVALRLFGPRTRITIDGSDTMLTLGRTWGSRFESRWRDTRVQVTGDGTGGGIKALIERRCDIAQASRPMSREERELLIASGRAPYEFKVAVDAVAVGVHADNPVQEITFRELADVFSGSVTNWKSLGGQDRPIRVLVREPASGTGSFFLQHVVWGGVENGPQVYAPSAVVLDSPERIAEAIAADVGAIGYYGFTTVARQNKMLSVRMLADTEAVLPTKVDAAAGRYPLSRPLFLYTAGPPAGMAKELIDFALSPRGQQVVEEVGLVALPESDPFDSRPAAATVRAAASPARPSP